MISPTVTLALEPWHLAAFVMETSASSFFSCVWTQNTCRQKEFREDKSKTSSLPMSMIRHQNYLKVTQCLDWHYWYNHHSFQCRLQPNPYMINIILSCRLNFEYIFVEEMGSSEVWIKKKKSLKHTFEVFFPTACSNQQIQSQGTFVLMSRWPSWHAAVQIRSSLLGPPEWCWSIKKAKLSKYKIQQITMIHLQNNKMCSPYACMRLKMLHL